jgi:DnaJ-class molecular chaperone
MHFTPVICGNWVIYRCPACKGSGCVTIVPEGLKEPITEDPCEACGGIGLVKISMNNLKSLSPK